jgi:3-methyladenine DNA glycosylase/8-oxoguanine DNA glycosylase
MFNDNWDPYETLQNHDEWIAQMAQHNESLAELMKDFSKTQAKDHDLIRQMVRTIQMQQNLISSMDDRIQQLEEKYEGKN